MVAPHTPASRLTTVAMSLLAATLLGRLVLGHHHSYVDVLLLTVLVLLAATTVKLHRDHCVESRMSAMALALACAGGVVLTAVAGVPGQPGHDLGASALVTLALSTVVVGLLALDRRRRPGANGSRSPYAL
jgi:hypothetical protein